jgi:hypothetical protein
MAVNLRLATVVTAGTLVWGTLAAMCQTDHGSTVSKDANPTTTQQKERSRILVAPAVKVNQANFTRPDHELQIAADPTDGNRLIVCSILVDDIQNYQAPWPVHIFVYTSLDGGLSWHPTYERDKEKYSADPSCAFGPDGSAYFVSFGSDIYAILSALSHEPNYGTKESDKTLFHKRKSSTSWWPIHRSTDGGEIWHEVGEVNGVDREYITVDDTLGQYRGRIYVHGIANTSTGVGVSGIDGGLITGIAIFRSTDGGQTYNSVKLADEGSQYVLENANGIVMSDGTFATIFADASDLKTAGFIQELHATTPNAKLKFISSTDGGETFGKATVVSDDWYLRVNGGLMGQPSLAVDRTSGVFRDRIYAAWIDARSGRGEIRLARSDNKGKTWSPSRVISDNWPHDERGETPDAFMPTLAVNRNGVLGIMWYDRRDHPDNLGYDIRFSASLDGGESFLPSVLVSPGGGSALEMKRVLLQGPWHPSVQPDGRIHAAFDWNYGGDNGGDTAGLACDLDGIFHPLWIDRRFRLPQASTTRITVTGTASSNGGDGLESLRDLSSKAEVRFSLADVDRATNVITIGAVITNTSPEPIPGRLTLRLLTLSSSQGLIQVQNADNGFVSSGAIWKFQAATGESLAPGAFTVPHQLQFKLAHAPFPPPPLGDGVHGVVEIDVKILGR